MAYDDSLMRRQGPGGHRATSLSAGRPLEYGEASGRFRAVDSTTGVPAAELDAVFDDPADQIGGRDRLLVHWLWELVLLLAVGTLAYLLWQARPDALRGDELSLLLVYAAGYGLLGLGAGVTLRAGVPNLAIGPVAAASMVYFAQRGDDGVITPTVVAVGAAIALGVAVAVLVTVFHVPGWAASLGAGVVALVWIQLQPAEVELAGEYDPTSQAALLFLFVAAVGMIGGLLGTLPRVRAAVGQFRPTGDPAARRGAGAAVLAAGAIVLSMVFAVPAGVLLAAGAGEPVVGRSGLDLTVIGLAVALMGGTSVFGRRGGVFGGTLAVVALVLFDTYQRVQGWEISLLATAAAALAGGLAVSRLVEMFGRPREGGDDWSDRPEEMTGSRYADPEPTTQSAGMATGGWSSAADSWSSALPAQPAPGRADPWDDNRWRT